ncbi:ComF family protein [Thalassobaculum sp. OXR-137]|uniref:ComF family protein n=1 Tax=Thalassobaculum sp. OXR-137 TaxID=3100173 RepID=UPI002AC97109|nr:ComF family protein [Thalassobaculum sp. OXR-137]WPZ36093.1 ComF family protein [Thalassobaculum sp. OXR-137]
MAVLAHRLLDLLLPPRCGRCGVDVPTDAALCLDCWRAVTFIADPLCEVCGIPFEIRPFGRAVCGDCLARPPVFDRARAAVVYDDATRSLILAFKHADRLTLAPLFAAWMRGAGADLLEQADVIVPVPLHRWRLLSRRYNQAAVLAHALGRLSGVNVVDSLLLRTRQTPSQGRKSASQRTLNVRGAFALRNNCGGMAEAIKGRRVVLVDDVFTTGATVSACTRVLRRSGARAVDVLTLARVT